MEVFEMRAAKYNQLAWVADSRFSQQIVDLAEADLSTVMLDLAAGTGAVSSMFRGRVRRIYALDSSISMLEQAKEALKDEPNIEFVHRDGQDTGFLDEFFDLVICRNGLHHFDDPRLGLREVKRILKRDGVFLLIEPVAPNVDAQWAWSELFRIRDKGRHPEFFFTAAALANYVREEGFETERSEGFSVLLTISNWVDTGSLSEDEKEQILSFVDRLCDDQKGRLGIGMSDEGTMWNHTWALLRLKKTP